MKKNFKFLLLFTVVLKFFVSTAFSQDTINQSKLTTRNSCIYYKKGSNTPFTGMAYEKFIFSKKINYIPVENGILSGKAIGYYKKGGAKKYESNLKYGDKNGEEIGYYESGKIQSTWYYENNKENGEEIQYYENGIVKSRTSVKDGKPDGKLILYYPSGVVRSEQLFENGVITNVTFYFEDGSFNYSDKYINGKRVK